MGILFRAAGKKKRFAIEEPLFLTITSPVPVGMVATDTYQVTAQVIGTRGTHLPLYTISWSSSNLAVATVATTGLVTAVGAGTATITGRVGSITTTIMLTVVAAATPASITITPTVLTMVNGAITTVYATAYDASAVPLIGQTVTWSTIAGTGTATVGSDSGDPTHQAQVTATGAGTVTVRATCAGFTSDCALTVQSSGSYATLYAADWTSYADTAAMKAVHPFTVESGAGPYKPAVTATQSPSGAQDFVELTSDTQYTGGIWSKVLRYKGGVNFDMAWYEVSAKATGVGGNSITLLIENGTTTGRKWTISDGVTTTVYDNVTRGATADGVGGIATVAASDPLVNFDDVSSYSWPATAVPATIALTGGAIGVAATARFKAKENFGRSPSHSFEWPNASTKMNLWFRTYLRFSTQWNTLSNGTGNGSDWKTIFLRMRNGGRSEIKFGTNVHGMLVASYLQNFGPGPVEYTPSFGKGNMVSIYPNYTNNSGIGQFMTALGSDFNPIQTFALSGSGPLGNYPGGDGDSEWYEVVHHFNASLVVNKAESSSFIRRYTSTGGTVVAPGQWRWRADAYTYSGTMTTTPHYMQLGVNRNGGWANDMWACWGPVELVDGSVYSDPFGVGIGVEPVS